MTDKTNYSCDMHTHSRRSDGNDTPRQLIDIAAEKGLKVLVLSDHDIGAPTKIDVDGERFDPVAYAARKGLIFIPGIEFSCDTQNDDVHIVGIGCDFSSDAMLKAEQMAEESKITGYRKLTEILCAHDIQVTWEDVLDNNGQPRQPEQVQRKHIFEAIANKGYADTWADAKLMVRENPVFNVKREKIDPLQAIDLIHQSGGLAILAHPYLIDETVTLAGDKLSRADYIERMIDRGLDGIEACYTYNKTSYKGTLSNLEIEAEVRAQYEDRLPIISGGSDYHHDALKGVKNPRELGEAGITWEYFSQNSLLKRFLP